MKIETNDYGIFYKSNGKWKQYKNYIYYDYEIENELKNVRKSVRKPVKVMRLFWGD